jgi:hypothetical protein
MAFLADYIMDLALSELDTAGNRLDICSAEPTNYTQATSTNSLGNKTALSIGAPADRTPNGRKVTIAAITDGTVTATGTATHWAITKTGTSTLMATGALSASQAVSSGNTFTLAAFDIGIPDAV